jgi:hypothetical protein
MPMSASREPTAAATEPPEGGAARRDRRRFVRAIALGGAGVTAGAALAPVLGGAGATAAFGQTATTIGPPTIPPGDVTLVNYLQGLELALQQLYTSMASTGKLSGQDLGNAREFAAHHGDHASAFAALAGTESDPTANTKLLAQYNPQIAAAANDTALVQIALGLENAFASTHQQMMGTVVNWQSAGTVASVEPIEAQHAVVWSQTLGLPLETYVPAFQSATGALDPTKFAG